MNAQASTVPFRGGIGGPELSALARDYQRMETTLEWLVENFDAQPPLETIAGRAGLTPFHFQRVFSRWVGLSPKKFVQFLSLERAKRCLNASESVLDAAFSAGLSGAGRLHDLFVTLEAVTPGEYKRRGEGLEIRFGYHPSPFGECLILTTDRGICGLAFVTGGDRGEAFESLIRGFENASLVEDPRGTAALAERIFSPRLETQTAGPLNVLVRGSRFQVKVWEALLKVPPGSMVSYSELARRAHRSEAVRAAAGAAGVNAVAYLIPCHRAIRKSGLLGGYRWGLPRKLAMLSREAAQVRPEPVNEAGPPQLLMP
ncbi:MAG TPA: methylated-DNA--[protein]-cysteine S-methyltransferase [Gammaproteobacteria bacterium]|nr:methylated-DNA--[protein]-cysteine S-methyltransferase [Gammaproteobacteria bacterium]